MPAIRILLACVAVSVVVAAPLPPQAFAHGSCTAARMKNVGKRCRAIARCHVAEALGRGDSASCVAWELQRLERHFQESMIYPDCHPYGDPPDVIAALDAAVSQAAQLVQLAGDRCSRSKMDAAGRLCLHLLRDCEAPAEVDGVPASQACLDEEAARLARLFDKAELRGGCATADDETAIQDVVRDGVDGVVTELTMP